MLNVNALIKNYKEMEAVKWDDYYQFKANEQVFTQIEVFVVLRRIELNTSMMYSATVK